MNTDRKKERLPKIIVDTNIYVSAYIFGGLPSEILELAQTKKIILFLSPEIIRELASILIRKFFWTQSQIDDLTKNILQFAFLNYPHRPVADALEDPDDHRILECALEAEADCVVSGDNHLLKLKTFSGIAILTPRQFLETYGFLNKKA
ncbi:MAG: putative toxin-antitoxin system toxin component, PIN family [Patescibacteria group bacterium]